MSVTRGLNGGPENFRRQSWVSMRTGRAAKTRFKAGSGFLRGFWVVCEVDDFGRSYLRSNRRSSHSKFWAFRGRRNVRLDRRNSIVIL